MKKRLISLALVLAIILVFVPFGNSAAATSSNNTWDTAVELPLNTDITGNISDERDKDWYVFTLTETCILQARLTFEGWYAQTISVYLYSGNGNVFEGSVHFQASNRVSSSSNVGPIKSDGATPALYNGLPVYAGTYYVLIASSGLTYTSADYTFSMEYTPVDTPVEATQTYNITAMSSPAAGGSVTGGGTFNSGDTVTLTARPNNGFAFDGWYEGGVKVSADTAYTFTATANRTLEARFTQSTQNQIKITAVASPASGGTVTGGGTFQSGATVSLQATANSGWKFLTWFEGGAGVIADANYTFTAAADRTLEAIFVQKTIDDPPFDNPHDDWAEEELIRVFEEDLFPPLLMDPGVDLRAPITRVEFAGIVVKTFENLSDSKVSPATSNPFSDTKDIYALMAYDANLMVGTSATTFAPDMILNRETAATALTRVFKKWYFPDWTYATDSNYTLDHSRPAQFADDAEISGWAYDSVYFMAANGIIRGFDGGTFRPKNMSPYHESVNYATATREQALIIALRMVENMR